MNANKRIVVTTTPYEGDNFPEAEHYPAYLANYLKEIFPGYEVEVTEGRTTRVWIYGSGNTDEDTVRTIAHVNAWEAFCAEGYKKYAEGSS